MAAIQVTSPRPFTREEALRGNAAAAQMFRERTAARLEELDYFLGQGYRVEEAWKLAGWPSEAAAARALARAGRRELAAQVERGRRR